MVNRPADAETAPGLNLASTAVITSGAASTFKLCPASHRARIADPLRQL